LITDRVRGLGRLFQIEWKPKATTTLAILAYWALGYFTLNRLDVEERFAIPRTPLDDAPLLPWTILVYHSLYVICGLGVWMHRSREAVWRHLLAVALAYSINFILFAIFPTEIDRPPLPQSGSIWVWALGLTWTLDAPHTCFPSLHVSNCLVVVCAYWRTRWRCPFLLWIVLICASTITVRQHLFWDIPSGAAVGIVGYLAARRILRGERRSPQTGSSSVGGASEQT